MCLYVFPVCVYMCTFTCVQVYRCLCIGPKLMSGDFLDCFFILLFKAVSINQTQTHQYSQPL